ncbi:hypothetical protein PRIPAC_97396 [Pristionchus pacificus]|uniref:Uncharacterized protein n=1 Tax=Pristionchus pacificus TaxID=54126 RepID=A0A2A6D2L3_PRIPA|nr:hypothetical protein PRIPAC_97396 [Pristionchus pacificus]|eukprot:PDM84576.1 hypothetical protein PRIPAC_33599 [Pristionchus pacificus]
MCTHLVFRSISSDYVSVMSELGTLQEEEGSPAAQVIYSQERHHSRSLHRLRCWMIYFNHHTSSTKCGRILIELIELRRYT